YYDFNSIGWEMHFDVVFSDSPNSYSKSGDYFLDNYFINDEGETFFYESYNVFDEQGTWEINGNVVTITINGDSFNAGISELTEERLILRINTTTTEVEDDFITTHSTVRNETYVFERD
ncbi:MAG: lipocalin family protein, partial [Bacteroidia bacterium]|nr:lipocalin family protein [Bacteroidia bacterium]